MERSHADHSIAIILDYEDICTNIKSHSSFVFKRQSNLMSINYAFIGELTIGNLATPSNQTRTLANNTPPRLFQLNLTYYSAFSSSFFMYFPTAFHSDTSIND